MDPEEKIIKFFGYLDKEVQKTEYGTLTVTVLVDGGLPVVNTTNIVRQKRLRYKVKDLKNE